MVWTLSKENKKSLNKIFRHLVSVCGDMDHVYEGYVTRGDGRLEDNFKTNRLDIRKNIKKIINLKDTVEDARSLKRLEIFIKKMNKSLLKSDWDPTLTPYVVELSNLIYHSEVEG